MGETDRFECKSNFGFKHQDKWLRPVAALANNAGGYVFFGVNDKDVRGSAGEDLSYAVTGMSTAEFGAAEPADFATRIRATFDPTPAFTIATADIGGKVIGVIHVLRHDSRPIIATRNEGTIKEGDIFYRYPGQSARIKYSDLWAILDARDADARAQILPMIDRLPRLGPSKAMVANPKDGTLEDGRNAIQIDASRINKLTFIKEGEFSDRAGAPTLRLLGDVHVVGDRGAPKARLAVVTMDDILTAFLKQAQAEDPKEFIRFAIEVGQGERLPLRYFARQAGFTDEALVKFINGTNGTPSRKRRYIQWFKHNAAFLRAVGTPKALLVQILDGANPEIATPVQAGHVSQAISALPRNVKVDKDAVLALLGK